MDELPLPRHVPPEEMKHSGYRIIVDNYLFGQFRIKLCRATGQIVREICTYKEPVAAQKVCSLATSVDPEAMAESWARPWNREGKHGRIRLDTTEEDNSYRGKRQW